MKRLLTLSLTTILSLTLIACSGHTAQTESDTLPFTYVTDDLTQETSNLVGDETAFASSMTTEQSTALETESTAAITSITEPTASSATDEMVTEFLTTTDVTTQSAESAADSTEGENESPSSDSAFFLGSRNAPEMGIINSALETMNQLTVTQEGELYNVVIPQELVGEDGLDGVESQLGVTIDSATENPDGSVTITMTEAQRDASLAQYKNELQTLINDAVNEDFYAISHIDFSDDLTQFKVQLEGDALMFPEAMMMTAFPVIARLHQVMAMAEPTPITITVLNRDGEMIATQDIPVIPEQGPNEETTESTSETP